MAFGGTSATNAFAGGGAKSIFEQAGNTSAGTSSTEIERRIGVSVAIDPASVSALGLAACVQGVTPVANVPGTLVFALDLSSSMNQTAVGSSDSKWKVTHDSLVEAICGVSGPGLDAATSVGIVLFPNLINDQVSRVPTDSLQCINRSGSTAARALGAKGSVLRENLCALLDDVVLGRGTPTADAYNWAVSDPVMNPDGASPSDNRRVLLITDGRPTLLQGCYNPTGTLTDLSGDEIISLIADASLRGIKTHIIGQHGSEGGREWMSKAAVAGGTASPGCDAASATGPYCHDDLTVAPNLADAMAQALSRITLELRGCNFDVSGAGQAIASGKAVPLMTVGTSHASLLGQDTIVGSSCTHGYRLVDGAHLELCEATCQLYRSDANARLQLVTGCSLAELQTAFL